MTLTSKEVTGKLIYLAEKRLTRGHCRVNGHVRYTLSDVRARCSQRNLYKEEIIFLFTEYSGTHKNALPVGLRIARSSSRLLKKRSASV